MEYVISAVGVGLSGMVALGSVMWHAGRVSGRLSELDRRITDAERNRDKIFDKLDAITGSLSQLEERTRWLPCVRQPDGNQHCPER